MFKVLVDTHCHLNFDQFDQDRNEVIERARESKVAHILNPGTPASKLLSWLSNTQRFLLQWVFIRMMSRCGTSPPWMNCAV